jgi:hypothetical protein
VIVVHTRCENCGRRGLPTTRMVMIAGIGTNLLTSPSNLLLWLLLQVSLLEQQEFQEPDSRDDFHHANIANEAAVAPAAAAAAAAAGLSA